MAFEAYEVILSPAENSPVHSHGDRFTLERFTGEICQQWPAFDPDTAEIELRPETEYLVSDTPDGLFQLVIWVDCSQQSAIKFLLRFAYCNPRSVYEPFCETIEGLMRQYGMTCHIVPDLAPEQQGMADEICVPEMVRTLLIPSMDYNRRLWQLEAGTEATAHLRPGDAVANFITPLLEIQSSIVH